MRKRIQSCGKCKKRKITVLKVKGVRVVESLELYKTVGLAKQNYTRWIKDNVLLMGCPKKDYFPSPDNKLTKPKKLRYYLRIDFAIAICFLMKRKKSIEIRNYLLEVKK